MTFSRLFPFSLRSPLKRSGSPQIKMGNMKKQTCAYCPSFEKFAENMGLCNKYNIEIWISLAKKAKICSEFELHHAMPKGNLTPTKRKRGEAEK